MIHVFQLLIITVVFVVGAWLIQFGIDTVKMFV